MKKIYINESQISKDLLLPKFVFDAVRSHNTSLGDNPAFPGEDDYPFDYLVLKERLRILHAQMKAEGIPLGNTDELTSYLSTLVRECKEMEKPIKDSLEKLCENAVNKLFAFPEGAINFKCRLVDKVQYNAQIGTTPEDSHNRKFRFKDISDFELSKGAVAKRRLINSLIMGAAEYYTNMKTLYMDELYKINPQLLGLYDKIMTLNSYLTFVTKEKIDDFHPMQGSFVEVHVGFNGKKSTIEAQGVIFPLMLHDAIKGFFELFSVYGLPRDTEKAKYIISKADFLLAEPWDMRFGVKLWSIIFDRMELVDDTNIVPYVFMELVQLPTEEFNVVMKELFMNTEKGDELMKGIIEKSKHNDGYQKFKNRINARNIDRSVIADSYFTASELDSYDIDGEGDGDVIEELNESAENLDFPLYHYTFLKFLVEMLKSGKFETSNRDIDYYKDDKIDGNYISGSKSRPYISFTRDKMYNVNMDKRWYDYGSKNEDLGPQIRIQFNPAFVKNVRYGRLQPYHYSDDYPDQREEKLFLRKNTDSIPFDIRFIDKIDILARGNTINDSKPLLDELASFPGVSDKTNVYFVDSAASQRKIDKTTGDILKGNNYKSYAKFLSGDENYAIPLTRMLSN